MEKQKHFFSRENRTSLLIALILTILNIAIVFCFDLQKLSFESRRLTAFQIIASAAVYILYFVFLGGFGAIRRLQKRCFTISWWERLPISCIFSVFCFVPAWAKPFTRSSIRGLCCFSRLWLHSDAFQESRQSI